MAKPRYGSLDHAQVWAYYAGGQLPAEIGRTLGRPPDAIFAMIYKAGGLRPAARTRSPRQLAWADREEISRGLAAGASCRAIARGLGRAPSTISREVAANGGRGGYRALRADEGAWRRAGRPKMCKLARRRELAVIVADKLMRRWSPQQIAGWLETHVSPGARPVGVTRDDLSVAVRGRPKARSNMS